MKTLTLSVLTTLSLITFSSLPALADDSRATWMQTEGQKLARIESQLSAQDRQALDFYLNTISAMVDRYHPSAPNYVCVSNGQYGSSEAFTVTDPTTGTQLGGSTSMATCRQVIAGMNMNLLCLSNGQYGSSEQFVPYDTALKTNLGGYTSVSTCQTLVTRSTPMLACVSNGQYGSSEAFTLYNRNLQRALGGSTQLKQCLDNLGQ
jgi:hypothetical protein